MSKRMEPTVIKINLSHAELIKWHALAKKQAMTFEQLAKEAVDLAWLRGSTR